MSIETGKPIQANHWISGTLLSKEIGIGRGMGGGGDVSCARNGENVVVIFSKHNVKCSVMLVCHIQSILYKFEASIISKILSIGF